MNTALIGLGRMGMRHAQAVYNCGFPLVGIMDVNPDVVERAGAELGLTKDRHFTSANSLLQTVKPELLIIATTAPSHKTLALEACASGVKAILCEKPMSTALSECQEMISSCHAADIRLAVNHQMRFMEHYVRPKQLAASDAFGGLTSIMVSAGNFGLAMNGTHYFEMFRFVTGEFPVKVSAWFAEEDVPNPRGAEFKDAAGCVRLETESGKRFYLDCFPDQGHGLHVTYNCRNGRICIDELSGRMDFTVRLQEHRDAPTTRYGLPSENGTDHLSPTDATTSTAAVITALADGEEYPTGEEGLAAMKVLVAAHISNQRGGAVVDLRTEELPMELRLPIA